MATRTKRETAPLALRVGQLLGPGLASTGSTAHLLFPLDAANAQGAVFLSISKANVFVLGANYPGETKEKK
jgi:hypothetical protein